MRRDGSGGVRFAHDGRDDDGVRQYFGRGTVQARLDAEMEAHQEQQARSALAEQDQNLEREADATATAEESVRAAKDTIMKRDDKLRWIFGRESSHAVDRDIVR